MKKFLSVFFFFLAFFLYFSPHSVFAALCTNNCSIQVNFSAANVGGTWNITTLPPGPAPIQSGTAIQASFTITNLNAGTYAVNYTPPAGYTCTTIAGVASASCSYSVTVGSPVGAACALTPNPAVSPCDAGGNGNVVSGLLFTVAAAVAPAPVATAATDVVPDNIFIPDSEVTFDGKNAARSGLLLDWSLQNYDWEQLNSVTSGTDPLLPFWVTIRNIVYAFFVLFVLITAFIIISTRGRSIGVRRFIPRFIAVILLVTFSYALIQFIYQITDIIQGFFLKNPDTATNIAHPEIWQGNLLYVGWDYTQFIGLRLTGDMNNESAFVSLLFVKLTALTYYVMVIILIIRRIILWFFIIVSPIFPLLLLYYPVRNTAKIWIGEFFRWALYAPLFAIFLAGLVQVWRAGVPLNFIPHDYSNYATLDQPLKPLAGNIWDPTNDIFPTAINILLGGPGQTVCYNNTATTPCNNSLNLPETFALYLVALLMLWMVIIVPWILLQIFLDYATNYNYAENSVIKNIRNRSSAFLGGAPPVPVNPAAPPGPAPSFGLGRVLPFTPKFNLPGRGAGLAKAIPASSNEAINTENNITKSSTAGLAKPLPADIVLLGLTNLSVPKMQDIARFETSILSTNKEKQQEVSTMQQSLEQIAHPEILTNTRDREHYKEIREHLVKESEKGNVLATTILNAANNTFTASNNTSARESQQLSRILGQIANPAVVSTTDRERITALKETLLKESEKGNTLATTILSAAEKTTNTSEMDKVRDQLVKESRQSNTLATTILSEMDRQSVSTDTKAFSQVLGQIANPAAVQTAKDQEVYSNLRGELVSESQKGNTLATTILSTATSTTQVQNTELSQLLTELASPEKITERTERERITTLKEKLVSESKEKNNTLATTLLSSSEKTLNNTEIQKVKEQLIKESEKGNTLATTLLSEMDRQSISKDTQVMSSVLEQLANPQSITTSTTDRQRITALKETLVRESKQGNTLATSILSATERTTSTSEMEKVRDQLVKESKQGNTLATSLLSEVDKQSASRDMQVMSQVMEHLANPASVTTSTVDRERISTLKETLVKESQQGNTLATSILSATKETTSAAGIQQLKDTLTKESKQGNGLATSVLSEINRQALTTDSKTQTSDVQKLKQRLMDARDKGDKNAAQILGLMLQQQYQTQTQAGTLTTPLPTANRVQQVNLEDYEAVKSMWTENYKNMDVPQSIETGQTDRKTWIKNDLENISRTIDLLSSTEQQKVAAGMREVSNILPFLMMGGFSQSEIVAYLKAKEQAGKVVLEELISSTNEEEDTTVEVKRETTTVPQHLTISRTADEEEAYQTPTITTASTPVLVDTKILTLTNLSLPTLRDIAKFETSMNSSSREKSTELVKLQEAMRNLQNPEALSNAQERDQYTKMRSELTKQSQTGDVLATSILTALQSATTSQNILSQPSVSSLQNVLTQIANPQEVVTSTTDRERINILKETLLKESRQGNTLATTILSATEKTTNASDIQKLKDQLMQESTKGNELATTLLSEVDKQTVSKETQVISQVLSQIVNSALSSIPAVADRQQYVRIKAKLEEESKKGNQLATSLLGVNSKTEKTDLQKVKQKLMDAQAKGDQLAGNILSLMSQSGVQTTGKQVTSSSVNLPTSNRIQQVSLEDYEAVKSMWTDNYKNMSIPQTAETGQMDRKTWVKSDLEKVTRAIDLLSSTDQQKVAAGMQEVANVLPFLLMGGFSQSEIVAYLKAKEQAGKTVLEDLEQNANEEETLIEAKEKTATTSEVGHMTTASEIESPDQEIARASIPVGTNLKALTYPQVNTKLLELTNLPLPTLRDIVRYESQPAQVSGKEEDIAKVREVLERISRPDNLTSSELRSKYGNLKQQLLEASKSFDPLATSLLTAAHTVSGRTADDEELLLSALKTVLMHITYLEEISDPLRKEKYISLKNRLQAEKENGNLLAQAILVEFPEKLGKDALLKIKNQIFSEKEKKNQLAEEVWLQVEEEKKYLLSYIAGSFPSVNKLQQINVADYETVKKLWQENYSKMDIPEAPGGVIQNRITWLVKEIENIEQIILLLTASAPEKVKAGMEAVSNILPFLLLGGFSQNEIIAYLKAKEQAAKDVLENLKKEGYETEELITIQKITKPSLEMSAEDEPETKK